MAGVVLGPEPIPGHTAQLPSSRSVLERDPVERLRLVSFERNLWQVGVADLEGSVADVTPERLRAWFADDARIRELAMLRTCQRLVVFAVSPDPTLEHRAERELGRTGPWMARSDAEAVRHLYRIAGGLESRAPGEREVREQVRAATGSVLSRHPRPILRRLFVAAAAGAACLDGAETGSVADLAVEWLRPRIPAANARVLVLGAGTVGRRVAERLAPFARVTVVYRRHPPDEAWRGRTAVAAVPSEEMGPALVRADAVVAAAKTTGRLLGVHDLPVTGGPRWFVDLGLPRNIDPDIGLRDGTQLIDLDGLPRGRLPASRLAEMTETVDRAAERGIRELAAAAVEPWISELRGWAEEVRREEWERAVHHAGAVEDTARAAFERCSERIVRRLLEGPSRELRRLPTGPEMDLFRRHVLELFRDETSPGP